ncbi:MAG: serine hydrolase, partial [Holophagales bacterium]|nr:serine hydrolase [Holophagales bacterium]
MNPAAAGTSPPTSDPLSSTLVRHGVRGRRFRLLLLSALGILLLAALAAARVLEPELERMLHGANGYAAKWVCSNVFVSGRPVADAVADLPPNPLARWARVRLEEIERPAADRAAVPVGARVHASMAGLYGRTAVHRQGYGCTLVPPAYSEEDLAPLPILEARATNRENTADLPFPWGDAPPVSGAGGDGIDSGVDHGVDPGVDSDLDIEALHRAVDRAFEEPDPERLRNTRAVVVVHGGRLVAERYAEGFGPHTPLTGWSMTKTVTNTLVGLLEQQGRLDIHQPVSTPFWPDGDRRAQLDLDVLLRMSSGLEFEE